MTYPREQYNGKWYDGPSVLLFNTNVGQKETGQKETRQKETTQKETGQKVLHLGQKVSLLN